MHICINFHILVFRNFIMLCHAFKCHFYANDFHIFMSNPNILLNSGLLIPSLSPNIFIGYLLGNSNFKTLDPNSAYLPQLLLPQPSPSRWMAFPVLQMFSQNPWIPLWNPSFFRNPHPLHKLFFFFFFAGSTFKLYSEFSHISPHFPLLLSWSEQLSTFSWITVVTS